MMKDLLRTYKKQLIFGSILTIGAAWFVYAQVLLAIVNVTPPGNCRETDGGFNINVAGCIDGNFTMQTGNNTNISFGGTFCDACSTNSTLIEFVCGGSISPQYNNLAAAIAVNGTYCRCVNGRCV